MDETPALFELPPASTSTDVTMPTRPAAPRLRCADRSQLLLRPVDLDATIAADHEARTIWRFVEQLDLSRFYAVIEAREGVAGRDATDPKLLVALWLYATTQGVGSARELARLCESHDAYRWICGGVSVNHHMLSDFRIDHGEAVDELFTQALAVMMKQGLVTLTRVAQDGTRVRASAGAASFRREPRLNDFLAKAKEQVEHTKQLADDPGVTAREAAARRRAAHEREERIQKALAELPAARAAKAKNEQDEARVSTTDPESRVMKMGDGGFRPAYNLQFASTTTEGVIVGVDVTNRGSDKSQMLPMLEQIERRTAQRPTEHLVDGGFVNLDAIAQAAQKGTLVYAPVPQPRKKGAPAGHEHEPKPDDPPAVAEWRKRMGTEAAKQTYKDRAATAELVNADLKAHRGLMLPVRSLTKVLTLGIWYALAYNVMKWAALSAT
jgi:transposase